MFGINREGIFEESGCRQLITGLSQYKYTPQIAVVDGVEYYPTPQKKFTDDFFNENLCKLKKSKENVEEFYYVEFPDILKEYVKIYGKNKNMKFKVLWNKYFKDLPSKIEIVIWDDFQWYEQ